MPYQKVLGSYTHTQSISSDTWTIVHNLNVIGPVVDVWIINNGVKTEIIPASTTASDTNTVIITFSSPHTGTASVV